ncbi:MAG: sigma-54-dependent Fis family transcriptional regulator [Zetaproteobacteria bacterium]|nr:MAG: sigma-54-dependent Fis family transcriptional regulator [Zetaproteobacteria bacterium]
MRHNILIIDDNDINRLNLKLLLKREYAVFEAGDLEAAEEVLGNQRIDLVLLDLALPPEPDNPEVGLGYLATLRETNPDLTVIVITGHDAHEIARRAQQLGAAGFFAKPFQPEDVHEAVARAMEALHTRLREQALHHALQRRMEQEILGDSPAMCRLRAMIDSVAPMPSTVLIRGETGTGKELVARQLHARSLRSNGPFVAINCAAIRVEHLELELFGHEKGAFPGADRRKLGWFERASGGTLYLDEVANLPLSTQVKLLRVLEHGELCRVGGEATIHTDVRLICSTRKALDRLVRDGLFRDDLYFRIHVVEIEVPPLRAHLEDLPALADHILQRKALECGKEVERFGARALRQMAEYDWPGNVRELENIIERAVVLADGPEIDTLPPLHGPHGGEGVDLLAQWIERLPRSGIDADKLVARFERMLIEHALALHNGVKIKAGQWLGYGDSAKDRMRYQCEKFSIRPGAKP